MEVRFDFWLLDSCPHYSFLNTYSESCRNVKCATNLCFQWTHRLIWMEISSITPVPSVKTAKDKLLCQILLKTHLLKVHYFSVKHITWRGFMSKVLNFYNFFSILKIKLFCIILCNASTGQYLGGEKYGKKTEVELRGAGSGSVTPINSTMDSPSPASHDAVVSPSLTVKEITRRMSIVRTNTDSATKAANTTSDSIEKWRNCMKRLLKCDEYQCSYYILLGRLWNLLIILACWSSIEIINYLCDGRLLFKSRLR